MILNGTAPPEKHVIPIKDSRAKQREMRQIAAFFVLLAIHILHACDPFIQVATTTELKEALNCARTIGSTTIIVSQSIASTSTFVILETQNLTIKAVSPNIVLSGVAKRIFDISNSTVNFSQLIFQGNNYGGAISLLSSNISIHGCSLYPDNLILVSANSGGGIKALNMSNIYLENSTISNWRVGEGGGIYLSSSNLYIKNSILKRNEASRSGGAIFMTSHCEVIIADTDIVRNIATNDGGGIYSLERNILTLKNSILENNTAGEYGGGLYLMNTKPEKSLLVVKNVEITGNEGSYSGGIHIGGAIGELTNITCLHNFVSFAGGCLGIFDFSIVSISRLSASNNFVLGESMTSSIGGVVFISTGAEFSCADCYFVSNFAGNGGVIANVGGVSSFVNSLFSHNSAQSGGVLFSQYSDTKHSNSFENSVFLSNEGTEFGGVFYIDQSNLLVNNSFHNGNFLESSSDNRGGILYSSNSSIIFKNITVTNSHAAIGGAFLFTQGSSFLLINSVMMNLFATNNGGVLRAEYDSHLWLFDTSFINCRVEGNGGVMNIQASARVICENCNFMESYAGGLGGHIYALTDSYISLVNSTFRSGNARGSGGCIASSGASIDIKGGSLTYCRSRSGGAVYLQSSSLNSTGTIFAENSGDQGGAILGDAETIILMDYVHFLNNTAAYKGGAALLTGGTMIATDSFFNCSQSEYGGAIHSSVGSKVILLNSKVTHNSAVYEGGAMIIQSGDQSHFGGTIFEHNYANTGAVGYLTNSQIIVTDCFFAFNEAFESGGTFALVQSSYLIIRASTFRKNKGYLGGVFFVDDSAMSINSSHFSLNSADSSTVLDLNPLFDLNSKSLANGYGGIFYAFLSTVSIMTSSFFQNSAYVGGIGWVQLSAVHSQLNTYTSNLGYNGGVYYTSEHNFLNSTIDIFRQNFADGEGSIFYGVNYGAIFLTRSEFFNSSSISIPGVVLVSGTIRIDLCVFNGTGFFLLSQVSLHMVSSLVTRIENLAGGAIQVSSYSYTSFLNCTFTSNVGQLGGGALSFKNSNKNFIDNCHFERNYAVGGSCIQAAVASLNITNSRFISNVAREAGGGIFWADSTIYMENNTFRNNSATYGPDYATTPKALVIVNPNDFSTPQNSGYELTYGFKIIGIDYYDQPIHLSTYIDAFPFSSIVVAQTTDSVSSISGLTLKNLDVLKGYTIFSNLTVTLRPASNVTLEFAIQGSTRVQPAFIMLQLRNCHEGEIETAITATQAICSVCKEGYYSFDPTGTCKMCPSNAYCPGGHVIDVQPGYWRQCQSCHEIKQCKTSHACLGGTNTSEQCAEGYHGPLCDICSDGYFRQGRNVCVSCASGNSYLEIIFAILLLVMVIFIFVFWAKKEWIQEKLENLAVKVDEALEKYELKPYLTKMKILIGFLQILVSIPEVLAIVFPKSFSLFLNSLNLINMNFFRVFATQCYWNENFYTDLLLSTIFPPCISFLIDSYLRIKYKVALRLNEKSPFYTHKQKNIHRRIMFLIIAFCVFSPVSITIFQTFVCEKFEDGESYLVADYSVTCYTSQHFNYCIYAGFMIILYPLGIPAYYIYHLARKKELINPPTSLVVRTDEKNIVSALVIQEKKIELRSEYEAIQDISFLYDSYLPNCWYFEIVECFRRIALTALPILFLRSTALQVVLVLIVSLGFSALYMELRPFVNHSDNVVAIVSQWTLSLTFLGALCVKIDMTSENIANETYLGAILSLLNGLTLILTLYLVVVGNDENDVPSYSVKETEQKTIKIKDIKYDYDSDDDSISSENKFHSIELEKSTKTQEIRSLREYQRKASLKQMLEQKNTDKVEDILAESTNPVKMQQESKIQRKVSIKQTSKNHNQFATTSGNDPTRPSEAEDYQLFRYSTSQPPVAMDPTSNQVQRKDLIKQTSKNHNQFATTPDNDPTRPSEAEDYQLFRYSTSQPPVAMDPTSNPLHSFFVDTTKQYPIEPVTSERRESCKAPHDVGELDSLERKIQLSIKHRLDSTPDSDDEDDES